MGLKLRREVEAESALYTDGCGNNGSDKNTHRGLVEPKETTDFALIQISFRASSIYLPHAQG